jgi:membrane protein
VHVSWHDVWIGAAVTAALFAVGKFLIGLYLGKSSVASAFGAAGSFVVLLRWVYDSAQIFLFGAEFTWVDAHEYGSRRGAPRPGSETLEVAQVEPQAALPVPVSPPVPVPATRQPGLRERHPFGFLGAAFVAGVALAGAKSLLGEQFPALKRRLT